MWVAASCTRMAFRLGCRQLMIAVAMLSGLFYRLKQFPAPEQRECLPHRGQVQFEWWKLSPVRHEDSTYPHLHCLALRVAKVSAVNLWSKAYITERSSPNWLCDRVPVGGFSQVS